MSFQKLALAAALIGVAAISTPAFAQDEEIQVTAPHFRAQSMPMNGLLEKVSLSDHVYYGDLDLRTRQGARELRLRVRDKAQDVCTQIGEVYPVRQQPGTSCYKEALDTGLIHANEAISDARSYDRYEN